MQRRDTVKSRNKTPQKNACVYAAASKDGGRRETAIGKQFIIVVSGDRIRKGNRDKRTEPDLGLGRVRKLGRGRNHGKIVGKAARSPGAVAAGHRQHFILLSGATIS